MYDMQEIKFDVHVCELAQVERRLLIQRIEGFLDLN